MAISEAAKMREDRAKSALDAQLAHEGELGDGEAKLVFLVASIAVEIWRLTRRIDRLAVKVGEENVKPIRESIRRLADLMLQHDVELREHEGEHFAEGLQFEVIHVRDQADDLVVVETITPSVILGNRVIRHGQVILGAANEQEVRHNGEQHDS